MTDTHAPIIDLTRWEQAQAILDARGESHAHRAASGSDYKYSPDACAAPSVAKP